MNIFQHLQGARHFRFFLNVSLYHLYNVSCVTGSFILVLRVCKSGQLGLYFFIIRDIKIIWIECSHLLV